jgi:phosphatidylglycerophosphate synthase
LLEPANLLSLVRFPLGAAAVVLHDDVIALLVLAAVAGITDVLDGAVARWLHPERRGAAARATVRTDHPDAPEPIGAWLDPLCDKAFVVGWIAAIALRGAPLELLALVGLRDVGVAILGTLQLALPSLRARRRRYTARPSGKVTTVLQFAALVAMLLDVGAPWPLLLSASAALVGLVALGEYVQRAWTAPPRSGS